MKLIARLNLISAIFTSLSPPPPKKGFKGNMSIDDLPNEILDKIFKYLTCDNPSVAEQIWGLAGLSRASRRLHILAESHLYSSFDELNKRTLLKYLRTVLERPQLASNVNNYNGWHKSWTYTKYSVTLYFSWRSVEKSFIENVIQGIVTDRQEAQDWLDAIGEGSWDATTALALAHLPRLQRLHLAIVGVYRSLRPYEVDTRVGNYYWTRETLMRAAQLQRDGISSPLALQHLTTVTVIPNQEKNRELSMSQLLPFLKLKSMRKLVARGWDLVSWDVEANIELTIVEMELLNFNIQKSQITPFFACFPALEKLSYENYTPMGCREHRPLVMNSLSRALIKVGPPLKELCIADRSAGPFCYAFGDPSLIQSFSPFKYLEVIDMPAFDRCLRALWPVAPGAWSPDLTPLVELLPSSIKQLTLRDASEETILHVMGLLCQRACVPDLKVIKIVWAARFGEDETGEEEPLLKEEASRHGIVITIQDLYGRETFDPDMADVEYYPD
jgi:hypothetical protein